jgi:hypothetical protein
MLLKKNGIHTIKNRFNKSSPTTKERQPTRNAKFTKFPAHVAIHTLAKLVTTRPPGLGNMLETPDFRTSNQTSHRDKRTPTPTEQRSQPISGPSIDASSEKPSK